MSTIRYPIENSQLPNMDFRLSYVTASQYGKDWISVSHTHHFTELFYICEGSGSFYVEGKTLPIGKDDLIIVNPYTEHTEMSMETDPLEYIALGIEGLAFIFDSLSLDTREIDSNLHIHNFSSCREDILYYLNSLLKEVEGREKDYEIVCRNLLELFIIYLKRKTSYDITVASNEKMQKECVDIKRYIDNHYSEDISLDSLAAVVHVNKYYLSHCFAKYLGTSPINYLIDLRIRESKYLLATTNYSVLHISSAVGFSSLSYFSQAFKKNTGMTPLAYRKKKGA